MEAEPVNNVEVAPGVEDVDAAPITPAPLEARGITNAREWRAKKAATWRLTLPSMTIVRVRQPDLVRLVMEGKLTPTFITALGAGITHPEDLFPMARAVIPYVVVEPQVVGAEEDLASTPDAIAVSEIPDSDLLTILLWVVQAPGVAEAAAVREE